MSGTEACYSYNYSQFLLIRPEPITHIILLFVPCASFSRRKGVKRREKNFRFVPTILKSQITFIISTSVLLLSYPNMPPYAVKRRMFHHEDEGSASDHSSSSISSKKDDERKNKRDHLQACISATIDYLDHNGIAKSR